MRLKPDKRTTYPIQLGRAERARQAQASIRGGHDIWELSGVETLSDFGRSANGSFILPVSSMLPSCSSSQCCYDDSSIYSHDEVTERRKSSDHQQCTKNAACAMAVETYICLK